MKLLIAIPTLTIFYNYPTYCLLVIVGLLFILQVISEVIKPCDSKKEQPVIPNHYNQVKEVFNSLPDKITCVSIDFTGWSYREIQLFAKSHGIRSNQKKVRLIELLQEV